MGEGGAVSTQGQEQVESVSLEGVLAQRGDRDGADIPPTPLPEQPGSWGEGGAGGGAAPQQESGSWCPVCSQGWAVTQSMALNGEPIPVCGERSRLQSRIMAQL